MSLKISYLKKKFKVIHSWPPKQPVLSANTQDAIEKIWHQQCKIKPLTNGKIFCIKKLSQSSARVFLTKYKTVLAQRLDPKVYKQTKLQSLAVSGVVFYQNKIGLALRSITVSQDPNHWELFPSGGVSLRTKIGQKVDCTKQLLQELKEETGLSIKNVANIDLLFAIADGTAKVTDLCYSIKLHSLKNLKTQTFEYKQINFVAINDLEKFLAKKRVAPVTQKILKELKLCK